MADISKINLSGAVYNIKDATARANLNEIQNISDAEIDEITDFVLESLPSSYVYGYETAAAMQADLDLQEGMIVHINGFTTSGDGNAAYYTISNSGTVDGATILALQNGLRAIKVSENNSVTNAKIVDSAITTAKIADNAVDASKIASSAADGLRTMSTTQPGVAKVGAGLAMNNGALELNGNGDISAAVTAWLNAHPEATTTVQDDSLTTLKYKNGSITDAKLVQTGGVLSLADTTLKIDALALFAWDFGAILGSGDYNANIQYNNYFSFGILDASRFESLYLVVPSDRKVNICYYDSSGAFVSRSADISGTTYPISHTYGIRLCVATTYTRSSQEDTLDEVLAPIGIYGCVRREEPDANAIVQADLQMQMYGPTSAQVSDSSVINASGVDLKSSQTLTAREGYRVALYNSNAGLVTGWSESIMTERPYFGAYIVVRKEPRTAIDLNVDGKTLTSYIEERIATASSKTVTLKPSAIQDVVDVISSYGIDARSRWNNKKVAFVGDSITYGVNTINGNIYYQLLDEMIGFSSVYASGVAGSCYSVTSDYGTNNSPIAER